MGQIKKCERAIKQTLSRQCVSKVERTNTKECKAAKNGHVSGWIFQQINSLYRMYSGQKVADIYFR